MTAMGLGSTEWSERDNGALIDAYMSMLRHELASQPYTKTHFNRSVVESTGRSRGSVEFKFCNVSAILASLGLPYIAGYKPRSNYQLSLAEAVQRHPFIQQWRTSVAQHLPQREPSGNTRGSTYWSALSHLWPYATGGEAVAARPNDFSPMLATGPKAAGLDATMEWCAHRFQDEAADGTMVFLIGGPGAGKSHAARELVEDFPSVNEPTDGLAHRVYKYQANPARILHVINDATIPSDNDNPTALALDVDVCLQQGSDLFACINRGILIEETSGRQSFAASSTAHALVRWLSDRQASSQPVSAALTLGAEQEQNFLKTAVLTINDRAVDIVAVYLDVCSLLEPSPKAEIHDEDDAPRVEATPYRVLNLTERPDTGATSIPAGSLFREALAQLRDALTSSPSVDWDPIAANIDSLTRDPSQLRSLLTMLRSSEFVAGQYMTYRELWGAFSRAILGHFTFNSSPSEVQNSVLEPLPVEENVVERWERLRSLAAYRWHQALFDSAQSADIRVSRDPIARITLPMDPARDARPGYFDPRCESFGWATPVIQGFAGHSDTSPLQTIFRSLIENSAEGEAHAFIRASTRFDALLDDAYVQVTTSGRVTKESELQEYARWYGAYLLRAFAASLGITAHREAYALWSKTYGLSDSLPSALSDCLSTLLRPRVNPLDSNSTSVISLFDSKTAPLTADAAEPRVGIELTGITLQQRRDRRGGLMLVLFEKGQEIGEIELDFLLIRDALASTAGRAGMTDLSHRVGPRLERFRAARLRPDKFPDGQTYVAVKGTHLAQFAVKDPNHG